MGDVSSTPGTQFLRLPVVPVGPVDTEESCSNRQEVLKVPRVSEGFGTSSNSVVKDEINYLDSFRRRSKSSHPSLTNDSTPV